MIKKLESKEVYKNSWMKVREDKVSFPNGHEGIYGVVEKPGFCVVIPFDRNGFYLVKQYRYPVQGSFWEFPQGGYEGEGTKHSLHAIKELEEETGLIPRELVEIGFLYEAYGYCNQGFHIFLASNFKEGSKKLDATESDLISKWFSEDDFQEMIDDGSIRDAHTVASYSRFLSYRNKNHIQVN